MSPAMKELKAQDERRAQKVKAKKPHRRHNVDLEAEGVTKGKLPPQVITVAKAGKGDEAARKVVHGWTEKTRTSLADKFLRGLAGSARDQFITHGTTPGEQREIAAQARRNRQLIEEAARTKQSTRNNKENKMRNRSTSRKNTKTNKSNKPVARKELPAGHVTPAEVANAAGCEPRELRRYLRANGIAKDEATGRYHWTSLKNRTVQSIVKGVKAELA